MGIATSSRPTSNTSASTSSPRPDFNHRQQLRTKTPNPTLVPGLLLITPQLPSKLVLCKPKTSLQFFVMRHAALLIATILLGSAAHAGGNRATAQGPSEQFATAEAMRVVPKGATITGTTCKSIDVGLSSRYQCTITYSPRADR